MNPVLRLLRPLAVFFLWSLVMSSASAQTPTWEWAKTTGTERTPQKMVTDAAGNVYVTGSFQGTAHFGATTLTSSGDYDIFIAKLDRSGTYQWAVQAGSDASRATSTPDDDSYESGRGLVLDGNGNLYVTGFFSGATGIFGGTTLTNPSSVFNGPTYYYSQTFVAKLSTSGQWQWAIAAGDEYDDAGLSIALDSRGNLYIMGEFFQSVTFGNITLNGITSWRSINCYVAKLNSNGTWEWANSGSGNNRYIYWYLWASDLVIDANGDLYLTGTYYGSGMTFGAFTIHTPAHQQSAYEGFVAKISASGIWSWVVGFGGYAFDFANALTVDATGNVYVAGNYGLPNATFGPFTLNNQGTRPTIGQNAEIFVAKLSPTGTWQWVVSAGGDGPGGDYARALAFDPTGNLTVAGQFSGTATFGSTTLTQTGTAPADTSNVFVAKLTPAGDWLWAVSGGGGNPEAAFLMALDGNDAVYVAGKYSRGSTTFGATTLPNSNPSPWVSDEFIARLSVNPLGTAAPTDPLTLHATPNPAHGTLHVQLPARFAGALTLTDVTGRTVRAQSIAADQPTASFGLDGVAPGVYLLRAGATTQRVLID